MLAGEQEIEVLIGRRGVEASASWLLDHGARDVVIKRGEHGAWATDGDVTWEVPAVAVTVVDPVGAGDAFAAGWLSAWLRGLSPQQRLREAALVAALVVAVPGDTDGLPTWQERDDALAGVREVRR